MTIRRGNSIIAGNAADIPSQTGQSGKFLTTNGTTASWATVSVDTSDCVKLTGDQTVAGNKTFSGTTAVVTPTVSDNSTKPATTAYIETKFQVVSALPASPDPNTYYFIPES